MEYLVWPRCPVPEWWQPGEIALGNLSLMNKARSAMTVPPPRRPGKMTEADSQNLRSFHDYTFNKPIGWME